MTTLAGFHLSFTWWFGICINLSARDAMSPKAEHQIAAYGWKWTFLIPLSYFYPQHLLPVYHVITWEDGYWHWIVISSLAWHWIVLPSKFWHWTVLSLCPWHSCIHTHFHSLWLKLTLGLYRKTQMLRMKYLVCALNGRRFLLTWIFCHC